MNTNPAYDNWREELIDGKVVAMAPAVVEHNIGNSAQRMYLCNLVQLPPCIRQIRHYLVDLSSESDASALGRAHYNWILSK